MDALPVICLMMPFLATVIGEPPVRREVLTLPGVLSRVEAAYPKVRGIAQEKQAAAGKLREKQGAFDTTVNVGLEYLSYNSASSRGKNAEATISTATVEMAMRSGAKLLVGRDANTGLVKSPISSTGSDGTIYAGIKLPLLRGAGINEKSIAELQAKLGLPFADAAITQVVVASKAAAGGVYWEWVAAGRKLSVSQDLLTLAALRAKQIAREVELGAQPPIAITEAEQEVRRREAGLNKAERDVQKAAIKLSGYLWLDDGTPLPPPNIEQLPSDMPMPVMQDAARLQASREGALAKRPEILAIQLQLRSVSLDETLALNDSRPDLSVVLQPGQDMGRLGIGDTLKAGINFSVPLGRWDASGRRDAARAKTIKLTQDRELTKRQVLLEVDDAWSAIQAAVDRFHATDAEVVLAKRLEAGERKRFAEGDSTLFLVNQRERATAEALGRLIDIQLEYQQALLALDAASIAL